MIKTYLRGARRGEGGSLSAGTRREGETVGAEKRSEATARERPAGNDRTKRTRTSRDEEDRDDCGLEQPAGGDRR